MGLCGCFMGKGMMQNVHSMVCPFDAPGFTCSWSRLMARWKWRSRQGSQHCKGLLRFLQGAPLALGCWWKSLGNCLGLILWKIWSIWKSPFLMNNLYTYTYCRKQILKQFHINFRPCHSSPGVPMLAMWCPALILWLPASTTTFAATGRAPPAPLSLPMTCNGLPSGWTTWRSVMDTLWQLT